MEKVVLKRYRIYTSFLIASLLCICLILAIAGFYGPSKAGLITCLFILFNIVIWAWKLYIQNGFKNDKAAGIRLPEPDIALFFKHLLGKRFGEWITRRWIMQTKD